MSLDYIEVVTRGIARGDLLAAHRNDAQYLYGTQLGNLKLEALDLRLNAVNARYRLSTFSLSPKILKEGSFYELMDYLMHEVYTIDIEEAEEALA
jgi:hypothetical protein